MKFVGPRLPPSDRDDDSRGGFALAPAELPIIAPVLGAEAAVVFAILMGVIVNAGTISGWVQ